MSWGGMGVTVSGTSKGKVRETRIKVAVERIGFTAISLKRDNIAGP